MVCIVGTQRLAESGAITLLLTQDIYHRLGPSVEMAASRAAPAQLPLPITSQTRLEAPRDEQCRCRGRDLMPLSADASYLPAVEPKIPPPAAITSLQVDATRVSVAGDGQWCLRTHRCR
ncbi:hypothetical protein [Xylella fastidiosa]|uniref:hypothetical protein n=1 Tax=Xylella fastidiosa TaxID=2371 RepID=UPI003AFB3C84